MMFGGVSLPTSSKKRDIANQQATITGIVTVTDGL